MAPLAHILALLAMTVATTAIEVVPLDMAQDSFDDQYRDCSPAMTAALLPLNRSEFQQNPLFAQVWAKAVDEWQRQGTRVSPLSSPDQAIALMAYTMDDLCKEFNNATHVARRSSLEYRDNFQYKTLHFLLTQALGTLRDTEGPQCHKVFRGVCSYQFEAQRGDTIRFGRFSSMSMNEETAECFGTDTVFQVHSCHGMDIREFSYIPGKKEVLIPPFETFKVTQVIRDGNKSQILLRSIGTFSKYNCEWLKGASIPRTPFHVGGFLLATTALAVSTGIL